MGRDTMAQLEGVCMLHSGQCEAIETLKQNEKDIFRRLHEVEVAVWKASAATGIITAIVVTILQKVIR